MPISEYIISGITPSPYIGVFHSTNAPGLSGICVNNSIECKKSDENVVFFFYGKPSYTLKRGGAVINEVSFVFRKAKFGRFLRATPFDTGGLSSGKYPPFGGEVVVQNSIDDILDFFSIGADIASVMKLVTVFFGGNESYRNAKPIAWPEETQDVPLFRAWRNLLILALSEDGFDPPASTIEIQNVSPFPIDDIGLAYLIIPFSYLDRPDVRTLLKVTKARPITYEDEVLSDKTSLWDAVLDSSSEIAFAPVEE